MIAVKARCPKAFAALGLALCFSACAPTLQVARLPDPAFVGPHLEAERFISFDGTPLGLTRWDARDGPPWAIIIGVHGMNDYANAFHLAAPFWARGGVMTLAYDQRGFGRSPRRGIWAPDTLTTEDLRTLVALARQECMRCVIAVVGESLGGAIAMEAFASDRPPAADRVVLLAPAVWGWHTQPLINRVALWLAARATPSKVYTPPKWVTDRITPTDNRDELVAMGHDPLMLWGARSDAIFGLVGTMQRASEATSKLPPATLYLYGANDQIIPANAVAMAVRRLSPQARTAFYAEGWHMLTRDHEGPSIWADVLAFIRDPGAPLPSGVPAINVESLLRRSPASGSTGLRHPPHG